jgi:hypothetical protein
MEIRMFVRRSLMVFALALSVARCADQPTALQRSPSAPQFLKWAGTAAPQFTSTAIRTNRTGTAAQLTPPLGLEQYAVSFWAVRGESRSVQLNYSSAIDGTTHPFLVLTTTDPQFVPGVGELAMGDSVLINVTVDTTKIGVTFEPSGLQFGAPAELKVWYGGAGGDLNGDGVADSTDAAIEAKLLGLWYREDQVDSWTHLPAVQSLDEKSFTYSLPHFCEYAIAEAVLDWAVSW